MRDFAFTSIDKRCRLTVTSQGSEVSFGWLFPNLFVRFLATKSEALYTTFTAVNPRASVCVPPQVPRRLTPNSFLRCRVSKGCRGYTKLCQRLYVTRVPGYFFNQDLTLQRYKKLRLRPCISKVPDGLFNLRTRKGKLTLDSVRHARQHTWTGETYTWHNIYIFFY